MAFQTTPEENGRRILDIYEHLHADVGQALDARNFLAIGTLRRWRSRDLQRGIEYAVQEGWLEPTAQGSLRLTERGLGAM